MSFYYVVNFPVISLKAYELAFSIIPLHLVSPAIAFNVIQFFLFNVILLLGPAWLVV